MKTLFKSINVVISLFLIIGALGVALLAFPIFGNKALIVRSGSMTPTIDVGSVIVVGQNPNYNVGDVIAFKSEKNPKTIITHRIVEVTQAGYKTQGDANNAPDGWTVKPKNVLGKTFIVVPGVGRLLAFARSEYGFPALIIGPAVLVMLLEAGSIIGEIRKKRKSKKSLIHPLVFPNEEKVDYKTVFTKENFGMVKVMIPLLAFALLVQSTSAFFSDTESSSGNFFAAASEFPSVTPSISPSPTPTSTPTPTPTPGGGCGSSIIISGNGAWSINKAYIKCILENSVTQTNNTTVNTNVDVNSDTGGNDNNENQAGGNEAQSGTASNFVETSVEGSSNSNQSQEFDSIE